MVQWIVVRSDVSDPARYGEFEKWYDEVHLPEMAAAPGFRSASLLITDKTVVGDTTPRYMAVYVVDDEQDFENAMSGLKPWGGRWGDYIRNWSRTVHTEQHRKEPS